MRNLYLLLTLTIIIMVFLIAFTFLYFEKEKHHSFIYTKEIKGVQISYARIDQYNTEDKIIYKSTDFNPKELTCKITHEKFVFDRKGFAMAKFIKECKNFGAITEAVYIKRDDGGAYELLTTLGSKFGMLSNVIYPRNISIFDAESIVTYMPLVDKYNFVMGGAQSFNTIYKPHDLLPPARCKIILRSIRDEYIHVSGKKTKTEYLAVKGRIVPKETYIWVSKKDRKIAQLNIKSRGLFIRKVGCVPKIAIQDYGKEGGDYDTHDIIFPSEDIALAGTIEIPRKDGRLSAVLLVAGGVPFDRDNAGLHESISRGLAEKGHVVLRFDRRGIGESQGDNAAIGFVEDIKDIEAALKFLLNHDRVDKDKIFILAHGAACSYLPQLDFSKLPAKGLIMLGVIKPTPFLDFESKYARDKLETLGEVDKKYPETLNLLKTQTLKLIKNTKKDLVVRQGKRVFLKRMSEILQFKPLKGFKKLDTPLLIIYDKKDKFSSPTYLKDIEKTLNEAGLQEQYSVVHFRNLGHFFGEIADEKNGVKHYRVNKKVLETIRSWVDKRLTL